MFLNTKFEVLYKQNFLTPGKEGLYFIVEKLLAEKFYTIPQISYILATAKHETADTFEPIAEYGKGKGKAYGVPDPATGQTYYGRGYVQLTWKGNYQKFSKLLEMDFVSIPDAVMEKHLAYIILTTGMEKGLFTGRKLSDYINENEKDYLNARRIINGTDKAELIAGYAEKFEKILKACT
jgi:putative chitinase